MSALEHEHLHRAFRSHERFLWGLCYRMTGSNADADDIVQDTFVRALERPPRRLDEELRPWLVRVAVNLSRDHLRRRRRTRYIGPWLPAAIETEDSPPSYEPVTDGGSTEGRYDLMESVSYAFLLALEALTPAQRAILLLRDVFDYSVHDTATALGMSETNIKTTHHRARRAMERYDRDRTVSIKEAKESHRCALATFVGCIAAHDIAGIEALLAEDVRTISDGGGVFLAALRPIVGRAKVIRFYIGIAAQRGQIRSMEMRDVNGMPAVLIEFAAQIPRQATRMILRCETDRQGKIVELHAILAPSKIGGVNFSANGASLVTS